MKATIIFLFSLSFTNIYSQILTFDQNWTQNTTYSDEFTYSTFPLFGQWYVLTGLKYIGNGIEDPYNAWSNSPSNLYIQTIGSEKYAVLELLNPSSGNYGKPYSAVEFESHHKYSFGYFEARIILPKGFGYHPTFWTWAADDSECWYNEIDILEPFGSVSEQCTTMGTNLHTFNGNISSPYACADAAGLSQDSPLDITNLPDLSLTWHTYGCEWLPDRVVWYFDNNVVRVERNPTVVPLHPQSVAFDVVTDNNNISLTYNKMKVDYFRYYELKTTDCNVVINQNSFNFSNPSNYSLKKSYTLANSTVPTGQRQTLRATDFIELGNNFDVPLGADITFQINPCF